MNLGHSNCNKKLRRAVDVLGQLLILWAICTAFDTPA
jgi:hypothetical protein